MNSSVFFLIYSYTVRRILDKVMVVLLICTGGGAYHAGSGQLGFRVAATIYPAEEGGGRISLGKVRHMGAGTRRLNIGDKPLVSLMLVLQIAQRARKPKHLTSASHSPLGTTRFELQLLRKNLNVEALFAFWITPCGLKLRQSTPKFLEERRVRNRSVLLALIAGFSNYVF